MPCDCPASCLCNIQAGTGTTATGDGSAENPFQVNLSLNGDTTTCNAVKDCIGANIDTSVLRYDPVTRKLAVRVSEYSEPGKPNTLDVITDGALFSPGSQAGCANAASVAGLPAQDANASLIFGNTGAGTNHFSWNVMRSIRAAIDLDLRGIEIDVGCLADGTPIITPCEDYTDYCYQNSDDAVGAGLHVWDLGINAWRNTYLPISETYRGARLWPNATSPSITPGEQGQTNSGPFVGYANGQNQIGGTTVAQALNEAKGQTVFVFQMDRSHPLNVLQYTLRDAIVRACAQGYCIVSSQDYTYTIPASQAGIQTGVLILTQAQVDTFDPDVLRRNGIDWIFIAYALGKANIEKFSKYSYTDPSTGQVFKFSVMLAGVARRIRKFLARDTQCRGAVVEDPVYYAEDSSRIPPLRRDAWAFGNYMSGQLHQLVETAPFSATSRGRMWDANDNSTNVPPGYKGWYPWEPSRETTVATTPTHSSTILGWASQTASRTNFTITWSTIYTKLPTNLSDSANYNGLGLLVGLPDDTPIWDSYIPNNFYWFHICPDGKVVLTRRLNGIDETGIIATPATAAPALGTWQHFRCTIAPTQVKLEILNAPGQLGTATGTATLTETAGVGPRGGYIALYRHMSPTDPIYGAFANFELLGS